MTLAGIGCIGMTFIIGDCIIGVGMTGDCMIGDCMMGDCNAGSGGAGMGTGMDIGGFGLIVDCCSRNSSLRITTQVIRTVSRP